ncbi:MAG: hypothetical protein CYPHOPRED_000781 [Cyphobasidiales sp. Tagirdzhanova-0007]|nr:MAG: hypothetical protein CYPHOPRED_000781 [Cyphobasidiales sp. Tagirdzhanova-0007]
MAGQLASNLDLPHSTPRHEADVYINGGYPKADLNRLREIHPELLSFEDWVVKNSTHKSK